MDPQKTTLKRRQRKTTRYAVTLDERVSEITEDMNNAVKLTHDLRDQLAAAERRAEIAERRAADAVRHAEDAERRAEEARLLAELSDMFSDFLSQLLDDAGVYNPYSFNVIRETPQVDAPALSQ